MPSVMSSSEASDTFVMDNGACNIKCGFSAFSAPRTIPNSITKAKSEKRRAFVGDQVRENGNSLWLIN